MIDERAPMSDFAVAQHRCPFCKATAGNSCVYTPPMSYGCEQPRKPSNEHVWARVGTPTKRPHNERYDETRRARRAANAAEELALAKIVPPKVADRVAAFQAESMFDDIERRNLVAWIAQHSSILIG